MIKTLGALALTLSVCLATPAAAQNANAGANSSSSANSASGSVASAGNSWTSNSNYKNFRTAPGFAVGGSQGSVGTCLGSRGIAVSTFWGGLGLSSTYRAKHCETMANSVRLQALGMKPAAKEVLCYRKETAGAMQATGYRCRVGKYANGINVRTGGNRPDPVPSRIASKAAPKGANPNCRPGQLVYYDSRNIERSCQ